MNATGILWLGMMCNVIKKGHMWLSQNLQIFDKAVWNLFCLSSLALHQFQPISSFVWGLTVRATDSTRILCKQGITGEKQELTRLEELCLCQPKPQPACLVDISWPISYTCWCRHNGSCPTHFSALESHGHRSAKDDKQTRVEWTVLEDIEFWCSILHFASVWCCRMIW